MMLLSEIEPNFHIFLKFVDKEYADQVVAGDLFMRNAQTYIRMEMESEIKGRGDRYDTSLVIRNASIRLIPQDNDGKDMDGELPLGFGEVTIRLDEVVKHPIYCLYCFTGDMMELESENETEMVFKPILNSPEIIKMRQEFSDTLVKIDPEKLIEKIQEYIKANKQYLKHGTVRYHDFEINQKERLETFLGDEPEEISFYKDDFFAYQNEYRFIFLTQNVDEFRPSIGDCSSFSEIFDVTEFLNSFRKVIIKKEPVQSL